MSLYKGVGGHLITLAKREIQNLIAPPLNRNVLLVFSGQCSFAR
jgi:hypothetical protein